MDKAMPASPCSQHNTTFRQADSFRPHNLVCLALLQKSIHMDAGAMRKSVVADNRLICRHRHSQHISHHSAGSIELAGIDTRLYLVEEIPAGMNRHNHLFHRGVTSPFTNTVNRSLDLSGSIFDAGEGIGHGQAEVIVAVNADCGFGDVRDVCPDIAD